MKLTQESVSQCTLNFPAEGTYTITATVNGPDGKTYQDSVKILVLSKIGMDRIVKQKWNGIKAKLTALDVEGAVSFLPTVYQDKYRQIFTAFGQHLPVLGEDSPPEFVYVANDIMKALVFREETVPGGTAVIGYPMYLIQEGGIWKFDNF